MLNAGNIARLYGTAMAGKISDADVAMAEKVIDELATLYTLEYSKASHVALAKEVLRQEQGRTDGGHGVEMTLRMHRRLENESRQRLFSENGTQQMKGYTSEIYNPHTALAVARDAEEAQVLKEQGYSMVQRMPLDPKDPDRRVPMLFALKDGGQMTYTTAALSTTGMAAKGTMRYGGMSNAFEEGVKNTQQANDLSNDRAQEVMALFKPNMLWDPSVESQSYLTPVLNDRGDVRAWRYMMQEESKDKILERDHRFDQVLGAMAGSIFDKSTSPSHNREVIKALHEVYRREFSTRPQSFVRIAHDSDNPQDREMYRLLPDSTQEAIRQIWGPDGMWVPYELLDVVFGYRKLSISKPFDKAAALREAARLGYTPQAKDKLNKIEEAFVSATEGVLYNYAVSIRHMSEADARTFARTAGTKLRVAERGVQEIVREIKDTIVVKGITTMLGNIKSNISLLVIWGIPPWEDRKSVV
jgi:hypothetical protein